MSENIYIYIPKKRNGCIVTKYWIDRRLKPSRANSKSISDITGLRWLCLSSFWCLKITYLTFPGSTSYTQLPLANILRLPTQSRASHNGFRHGGTLSHAWLQSFSLIKQNDSITPWLVYVSLMALNPESFGWHCQLCMPTWDGTQHLTFAAPLPLLLNVRSRKFLRSFLSTSWKLSWVGLCPNGALSFIPKQFKSLLDFLMFFDIIFVSDTKFPCSV